MKLRNKVFLISASLLSFIVLIAFFSIKNYFIKSLFKKENLHIVNRIQTFNTILEDDLENISRLNRDWAAWDETFNYVKNKNAAYIVNNLNTDTFANINVNFFAILDKDGNVLTSRHFDTVEKKFIYMPKDWINYINREKNFMINHKDINSSISGIISVNNYPAIVSCMPITNSIYTEAQQGTLIMGRYISTFYLKKINEILNTKELGDDLSFLEYDKNIPLLNNMWPDSPYYINRVDNNKIEGYSVIHGINGDPIFILKVGMNRELYQRNIESFSFFAYAILGAILLVFLIFNHLLQQYIINPIEIISTEIGKIDFRCNNLNRTSVISNDEVGQLSSSINNMLSKIEEYNSKIIQKEQQLSIVLEGANAGYWVYDISDDDLSYNDKFISIVENIEFTKGNSTLKQLIKLLHKSDIQYVLDVFRKNVLTLNEPAIIEHRILTDSGNYKWILTQGRVVDYDYNNKPLRLAGIITDIDSKKRTEFELNYLTYYDKLTNVFNRGYYEYMISKIDSEANLPISIIIGDLNGLKITNDTFGHSEGDKLLKRTAEILKGSCGNNAIICRWGGDEFTIILPNTDENKASDICSKIKENCSEENTMKVTIALGCSTKTSIDETMDSIIQDAEEKMYRNKLLENGSSRNSIISSLTKTLWEKNFETEEHTQRIFYLCEKVGKNLNLTPSQLDELSILAKLHDIGKIAIPDVILNKTSCLTDKEWDIMKTHTEIGYRIASSAPDLRPTAYAILSHHERYDGMGYPNGLKGEEIPLLSRLLSIVDAYDVMTHDRPYKKSIPSSMAIEELRKNSGTQFDPDLLQVCIDVFLNE